MDARTGSFVIEAVFVVKGESEEEAAELIENLIDRSGEDFSIIDGMVRGGMPSVSADANFMTSKKRRMFFRTD